MGSEIDENTVAVVAATCRAGTFSALTRDEHTDLVRSIILAYEAAKPVPPMSTSGEMVERLDDLILGLNEGARAEVKALFASQAADLANCQCDRFKWYTEVQDLKHRALTAEASLATIRAEHEALSQIAGVAMAERDKAKAAAAKARTALQSLEFQCETAIINLRQMPDTDDAVLRAFTNLMHRARIAWGSALSATDAKDGG